MSAERSFWLGVTIGGLGMALGVIIGTVARSANATEWVAVEPGECLVDAGPIKLPPEYVWSPATGLPDYYEVFACDWADYCAHIADVPNPEWHPGWQQWLLAIRRAKHPNPRVRLRSVRGDEKSGYSELCDKGLGIKGVQ